jgi:hypothetical protein
MASAQSAVLSNHVDRWLAITAALAAAIIASSSVARRTSDLQLA